MALHALLIDLLLLRQVVHFTQLAKREGPRPLLFG